MFKRLPDAEIGVVESDVLAYQGDVDWREMLLRDDSLLPQIPQGLALLNHDWRQGKLVEGQTLLQ